MTTSLPPSFSRRFFALIACVVGVIAAGGVYSVHGANPNKAPVLISESTSTRGIALESITLKAEPFSLTSSVNFGTDTRTRICIFAMNLELYAGESANAFFADAEDAAHTHYPLRVEYVGTVPAARDINGNLVDLSGITMIVVRLNDAMGDLGDVLVSLSLHGVSSNRVRVGIGHIGGLPSDQVLGLAPTPAPATPPPPDPLATPNPYTDLATTAGPDGVRFLEQATFGPTDADLAHLRSVGYRAYLNEQFNAPVSNYPSLALMSGDPSIGCPAGSPPTCGRDNYTMYPLQVVFYQRAMNTQVGNDQLRQRVSWALSQILVVSGAQLQQPSWVGYYLQKLDQNAFGNFRSLLQDVTLNPGMGDYLDMAFNNKNAPNENYAREIMQLFTVGLDQLNNDGTPKLDANGNRIPTYDQNTITNFARVFTGWVFAAAPQQGVPNYRDPMIVSATIHDTGSKTLLNGTVLPAGQTTLVDLNAALDNLFNHPNVGPFIGKQLIQHLVTSNPSPAYVNRVANAFNNNCSGLYPESPCSGARGDMRAVVTAILLDPEARGDFKTSPHYGRLKEPALCVTNLLRPYVTATDGTLNFQSTNLGQDVFRSPTVFNYYPADYTVPGVDLNGPQFGILTTTTSLLRANLVNTLFVQNNGNGLPASGVNVPTGTQINLASLNALADNPAALVDELNRLLLHNSMSTAMRNSIITAVNAIVASNPITATQRLNRTQQAIYLVASSSQYQVAR
jgi:hypothetical protein